MSNSNNNTNCRSNSSNVNLSGILRYSQRQFAEAADEDSYLQNAALHAAEMQGWSGLAELAEWLFAIAQAWDRDDNPEGRKSMAMTKPKQAGGFLVLSYGNSVMACTVERNGAVGLYVGPGAYTQYQWKSHWRRLALYGPK